MSALSSTLQLEAAPAMKVRERWLRRLAAFLAMAAVVEDLAIVYLGSGGDQRFTLHLDLITIGFLGTVLTFPLMGALIIQRRPSTRVAWLMIGLGLSVGFGLFTYAYGVVGSPPREPFPLALPAVVASQLFFLPAIGGATTWILLLYPTDHLLAPPWRWVGVLAAIGAAAFIVGTLFRPGELDSTALPGVVNPIGASGSLGEALGVLVGLGNVIGLGGLILAVSSLVLRYRRADLVVAAQIRWLALVAVLAVIFLAISLPDLPTPLDDIAFGLALTFVAAMPLAIGIAITRYRLYEIDRLINRALVYGALTAILAGVFTAGIGLAQRLFIAATGETSDAAIVGTTLIVATLYAPLRKRLESLVDRLFKYDAREFGAYRAELDSYLHLVEPEFASQRLAAEAIRELVAGGAAVIGRSEEVVATAGSWPVPAAVRVPIGRAETFQGTLLVGPRSDGKAHDPRDVEKLADLAMLVGAAIRRG
jgi:hypothetical protein